MKEIYIIKEFNDVKGDKVGIFRINHEMPLLDDQNEVSLFTRNEAKELCKQMNIVHVVDSIINEVDVFQPGEDMARKFPIIFGKIGGHKVVHFEVVYSCLSKIIQNAMMLSDFQ